MWDYYGFTEEQLAGGDFNPKMFNSFLDGTKSAIEMAAVANGTGLIPQDEGLQFAPAGVDDLPDRADPARRAAASSPAAARSRSPRASTATAPRSSATCAGASTSPSRPRTDYAVQCFAEYGVHTDPTGRFASLYRPYHMIGLELGVSIASAVVRGEATGTPTGFRGDVTAVAKRALKAGETLDGEGGYMVFGRLAPASAPSPRARSRSAWRTARSSSATCPRTQTVSWDDVEARRDAVGRADPAPARNRVPLRAPAVAARVRSDHPAMETRMETPAAYSACTSAINEVVAWYDRQKHGSPSNEFAPTNR